MTETRRLKVIGLRPTDREAIKPAELIRVSGHQTLSLYARRAITVLWHNAHEQGIQPGREYSVELSRLRSDQHRGLDVIKDVVESLMGTILVMKDESGEEFRTQFLGPNRMRDKGVSGGVLRYTFPDMLLAILQDSEVWGRITLPILMSFSSKYSVSLYENISQWQGLTHKSYHDFSLEEFREMLGVDKGKYEAYGALNKHVIQPVCAEINALAPFNIALIPVKEARKVARIRIGWSRKTEDELKEAYAEVERSRVGRRARISGTVELVRPMKSVASASRAARIDRRTEVLEDPSDA